MCKCTGYYKLQQTTWVDDKGRQHDCLEEVYIEMPTKDIDSHSYQCVGCGEVRYNHDNGTMK